MARDAFKLGQQILDTTGGPLTGKEINEQYGQSFLYRPTTIIDTFCGGLRGFWGSFDLYPHMYRANPQEILEIGVRYAATHGGHILTRKESIAMADDQSFVDTDKMVREFGKFSDYQKQLTVAHENFRKAVTPLKLLGVSEEVLAVIGGRYVMGDAFIDDMYDNADVLVKLSADRYSAKYVLALLKRGFDLRRDDMYHLQLKDFSESCRRLGINKKGMRYVLICMPRQNSEETLRDMKRLKV
jgi:hypothetical protein